MIIVFLIERKKREEDRCTPLQNNNLSIIKWNSGINIEH